VIDSRVRGALTKYSHVTLQISRISFRDDERLRIGELEIEPGLVMDSSDSPIPSPKLGPPPAFRISQPVWFAYIRPEMGSQPAFRWAADLLHLPD